MARRSKMGHFEVWNQGSDSYKHTDLAYNWDTLDNMIGSPNQSALYGVGDDFNNPTTTAPTGVGQWLYPQDATVIENFGNRTLYNIVRGLDFNSPPLGAVIAWWRPSIAVPLPSGWVPGDGSSYTGTDKHSYQAYGITTITVPDLRNKMILGAYETTTGASATALNRDGTAATVASVDTATAGPGIRGVGGTNVPRNLTHLHGVGTYIGSDHTHNITDHVHVFTMIDHQHLWGANTGAPTAPHASHAVGASSSASINHQHSVSGLTAGILGGPPSSYTAGMPGPVSTGTATAIAIGGSSANGLTTPIEILPQYYGLLYIVKIRKASPLHNTSFAVGP